MDTPPYISRTLDLSSLLEKKSYFLFGPRQTGKSSLIRHTLRGVRVYDLLDIDVVRLEVWFRTADY
jgi:predicted AAA+ superfamily ATPase